MNRRGFLSALIGGLSLDPEKLLWEPHKKLISIPATRPRLLEIGDVVTFAAVYAINPATREPACCIDPSTGVSIQLLKYFVVTETYRNGDDLALFPFPVSTGNYKNVSKLPEGGPFRMNYSHGTWSLAKKIY